jgi:uncharacterized protein
MIKVILSKYLLGKDYTMIKSYHIIIVFVFFIVIYTEGMAQYKAAGHWEGAIQVVGTELGIKTDFKKSGDTLSGTIDIPPQSAFGLPLKNLQVNGAKIHFELPAGPGLAVFDGILTDDSINGDFTQSGMKGLFHLGRAALNLGHPVDVKVDLYNEEEILIPSGKDTIGGTLTLPKTGGPFPAVIMITGSGAQNRDEEIFGFKPFRIIADQLTKGGIAVLRCDDRGVGKSTGSLEEATGKDFMQDVTTEMNYLKSRKDINPRKIGLCGHSEGATIAVMLAAEKKDVAFIVLMAGPGMSGDSIILRQIEVISRMSGMSDEEITGSLIMQNRVYEAIKTDTGWTGISDAIRKRAIAQIEKMPDEQRKSIVDVNAFAELQVNSTLKRAKSAWFKFFIGYNPAKDLIKIKCPVLALFGELDTQVDPIINSKRMQIALELGKNKDYTIYAFPKTNHLFQKAEVGSPVEYATLAKEFNAGVLDTLSTWILKRAKIE